MAFISISRAGSSKTGKHSKMRPVRAVLALIPVAFILVGYARALENGTIGGGAGIHSVADRNGIRTAPYRGFDEFADDSRPADDRSEFEIVMTTACSAGDVFGCGLLLAWRAVAASLHFLENLVILGLIAYFPWFVWIRVRETIERRKRKAKENTRDFSGRLPLPPPGYDPFFGPRPENESRPGRRPDR